MTTSLDGKVAVITGAASGIGRASVERFVEAGARVLAADIDTEAGRVLEAAFPGLVAFQRCDVTSEDDIAVAMEIASQTFGGLDILFNNAGAGGSPASLEEMTGELWDHSQDLLLRSVALGMRYAIPHMKARGGGAIVNTASVAALSAGMGPIAYSAAKAGVLHLSRCAAAELSKYGIRVNALCPGFILTNIFTPADMPSQVRSAVKASMRSAAHLAQPVARPGEADDIAQAALYLASPASAFVTGTHLVVDGGLTVGPRHSWDPEEQARRLKEREKLWAGAAELARSDA
ncbi:MAG TPA: SDR family NAD(P)-dependent oxidoreductase [Caulobacter sp.]|nr:SDR family NAD(P)-dependent oxidoreductase [Caulobacter sp.]